MYSVRQVCFYIVLHWESLHVTTNIHRSHQDPHSGCLHASGDRAARSLYVYVGINLEKATVHRNAELYMPSCHVYKKHVCVKMNHIMESQCTTWFQAADLSERCLRAAIRVCDTDRVARVDKADVVLLTKGTVTLGPLCPAIFQAWTERRSISIERISSAGRGCTEA